MKKIILFGAGKSATCLIDYLVLQSAEHRWQLTIIDADPVMAKAKVGDTPFATVESFDINDKVTRQLWIRNSDLVISLLPAALHTLVAKDCLQFRKHLLTASYISPEIQAMRQAIEEAGVLFMGEMGLDPGIDHMSAMKLLDTIRDKGGRILSFRGYCGALMAPESDNNPWRYKFSWNPMAVVLAGSAGATCRKDGEKIHVPYDKLFQEDKTVDVPGLEPLAYYPNRDSLHYASLYQLDEVPTILRATLRYPEFCRGWNALIALGLTDPDEKLSTDTLSYCEWALHWVPGQEDAPAEDRLAAFLETPKTSPLMHQLRYLGLLCTDKIGLGLQSNAAILLHLLTEKLQMASADHDMIVMMHQIIFEENKKKKSMTSSLIVKGEDSLRTAIAKTVGLPLGILAKLILTDKIQLTGLHIPVMPEIYGPVLRELEDYGIRFTELTEG